jgi:peptidoglycan/xylan/chitin deacetylase (PgdA/CDA1 family)
LLEKIASSRCQILAILTYHRIAYPGLLHNPYYDSVISATPDSFRSQMMYLQQRFSIIGLDDAIALRDVSRQTTGKPLILITFDDGYRDNFHTALPILQDLYIPATFFIATGFLQYPRLPWWDHVAHLIKHTQSPSVCLKRYPNDESPIMMKLGSASSAQTRTRVIASIIEILLNNEISDEHWFLDQLQQQTKVSINVEALTPKLFMSVAELRQLADAGMTIGAHSHSHSPLGQLPHAAQWYELQESKRVLENTLGREVVAVAYPFGWPSTFTPQTIQVAKDIGYQLGFSSVEGVNYPADSSFHPMSLSRFNVCIGDSARLLRARAALHTTFKTSFL